MLVGRINRVQADDVAVEADQRPDIRCVEDGLVNAVDPSHVPDDCRGSEPAEQAQQDEGDDDQEPDRECPRRPQLQL